MLPEAERREISEKEPAALSIWKIFSSWSFAYLKISSGWAVIKKLLILCLGSRFSNVKGYVPFSRKKKHPEKLPVYSSPRPGLMVEKRARESFLILPNEALTREEPMCCDAVSAKRK